MARAPVYVVVSGPPGSGKTTLAGLLAVELQLPLVAKDTIKEALTAHLEVPDVETSRRLGRASIVALLAVARACAATGAVLESAWHRTYAIPELQALPGEVVEVFCRCDPAVAEQRYRNRAAIRAPGHFDTLRTVAELANDEVSRPVAGGWPVVEVDTNGPADVGAVVAQIRATAAG